MPKRVVMILSSMRIACWIYLRHKSSKDFLRLLMGNGLMVPMGQVVCVLEITK